MEHDAICLVGMSNCKAVSSRASTAPASVTARLQSQSQSRVTSSSSSYSKQALRAAIQRTPSSVVLKCKQSPAG